MNDSDGHAGQAGQAGQAGNAGTVGEVGSQDETSPSKPMGSGSDHGPSTSDRARSANGAARWSQGLPWWVYLVATGAAALVAIGVMFGLRGASGDDDGGGTGGREVGAAGDTAAVEAGDFSFFPTNEGNVGDPVPATTYLDESGEQETLESYRGQPLVVNFWSSSCAPCVAEMPDFESVFQEYSASDNVAFVGINFGDTRDSAEAMVETTGVTYDIGRDTKRQLLTDFGSTTLPTTALVDSDGRVVEVKPGPVSRQELVALVDEMLAR